MAQANGSLTNRANNPTMPGDSGTSWPTRAARLPFITAIWAYRITLGPFLGGQCRFHPTCSQYALDAYHEHNPARASLLVLKRLARCHPLARGGFDPVPPKARSQ